MLLMMALLLFMLPSVYAKETAVLRLYAVVLPAPVSFSINDDTWVLSGDGIADFTVTKVPPGKPTCLGRGMKGGCV